MLLYKTTTYSFFNNLFPDIAAGNNFIGILETASEKFKCVIHSFSLMPNNYNLLIESDKNTLNEFLRYINRLYSIKHPIKPHHNFSENKLKTDIAVIEKNYAAVKTSFLIHAIPVLSGITEYPTDYELSSLPNFISLKKKFNWVATDYILSQASNRFFLAYLDYKKNFYHFLQRNNIYFVTMPAKRITNTGQIISAVKQ